MKVYKSQMFELRILGEHLGNICWSSRKFVCKMGVGDYRHYAIFWNEKTNNSINKNFIVQILVEAQKPAGHTHSATICHYEGKKI